MNDFPTIGGSFAPKAPPYLPGGVEEFEPYGVGYIELPGEVRVEARLTESDPDRLRIGMLMDLTLIPVPGAPDQGRTAFLSEIPATHLRSHGELRWV